MEATMDHPLLFELPEVKKAVRTKWQELKEMAECQEREGGLATPAMAAAVLDLSTSRVGQLLDEGTFVRHEFFGKPFLSVRELRDFIEVERKAGRPWKEPSSKELWKRSRGVLKEMRGKK